MLDGEQKVPLTGVEQMSVLSTACNIEITNVEIILIGHNYFNFILRNNFPKILIEFISALNDCSSWSLRGKS